MASGLRPAGMNLGGAVTPLLLTLLSGSSGWQGALFWVGGAFISGAFFALLAGGLWLVIDPVRRAKVDSAPGKPLSPARPD
jgi:hypothetical protein